MAKSIFTDGSELPAAWVNAMQDIQFDGQDIDGHYPPLTNASLANTSGNLRFDYYQFQNSLKVSHSSGLNFAYAAGSALTNAGVVAAIAGASIAVPDNATSWIYVTQAGAIAVAPAFPLTGMPLAKVTTAAGTIAGAIEDLRPRIAYPVGFLQNFLPSSITIYVSPTGNGSGLTVADPTSIDQAARLATQINRNGHLLTIKLADGTYAIGSGSNKAIAAISGAQPSYNDGTPEDASYFDLIFEGNVSNPSAVIFDLQALNAGILCEKSRVLVKGITFDGAVGAKYAVLAVNGRVSIQNCRFTKYFEGAIAASQGGELWVQGNLELIDSTLDPAYIFTAVDGGQIRLIAGTFTITGTPAISSAFALADRGGRIYAEGMVFAGNTTGVRYSASNFGAIIATGKGLNYFPGDAAGNPSASGFDSASGGIYRA